MPAVASGARRGSPGTAPFSPEEGRDVPDNMTPKQAAEYLGGLSTSFLAKMRMEENRHRGPAYVKIGKVVIYRRNDLDQWLASRVVRGNEAGEVADAR